jgi:CRISPR-associated protein Cas2
MSDRDRSPVYLLAYDICDNRRLQRVHKYLQDWGVPVQYSVFLLSLTVPQREEVLEGVGRRIDADEDDVRLYALPPRPHADWRGPEPLPEGVWLGGDSLAGVLEAAFRDSR